MTWVGRITVTCFESPHTMLLYTPIPEIYYRCFTHACVHGLIYFYDCFIAVICLRELKQSRSLQFMFTAVPYIKCFYGMQ